MPRKTLYIQPTKAAIAAAKKGLEARKKAPKSKRGGLDTQQAKAAGVGSGVARARDIIAEKKVNAYQVKAFFDRHRQNYLNAKIKGLKPEESKAIQAWLIWGGEPLRKQAEREVAKHEKELAKKKASRRKRNPIGTQKKAKYVGQGTPIPGAARRPEEWKYRDYIIEVVEEPVSASSIARRKRKGLPSGGWVASIKADPGIKDPEYGSDWIGEAEIAASSENAALEAARVFVDFQYFRFNLVASGSRQDAADAWHMHKHIKDLTASLSKQSLVSRAELARRLQRLADAVKKHPIDFVHSKHFDFYNRLPLSDRLEWLDLYRKQYALQHGLPLKNPHKKKKKHKRPTRVKKQTELPEGVEITRLPPGPTPKRYLMPEEEMYWRGSIAGVTPGTRRVAPLPASHPEDPSEHKNPRKKAKKKAKKKASRRKKNTGQKDLDEKEARIFLRLIIYGFLMDDHEDGKRISRASIARQLQEVFDEERSEPPSKQLGPFFNAMPVSKRIDFLDTEIARYKYEHGITNPRKKAKKKASRRRKNPYETKQKMTNVADGLWRYRGYEISTSRIPSGKKSEYKAHITFLGTSHKDRGRLDDKNMYNDDEVTLLEHTRLLIDRNIYAGGLTQKDFDNFLYLGLVIHQEIVSLFHQKKLNRTNLARAVQVNMTKDKHIKMSQARYPDELKRVRDAYAFFNKMSVQDRTALLDSEIKRYKLISNLPLTNPRRKAGAKVYPGPLKKIVDLPREEMWAMQSGPRLWHGYLYLHAAGGPYEGVVTSTSEKKVREELDAERDRTLKKARAYRDPPENPRKKKATKKVARRRKKNPDWDYNFAKRKLNSAAYDLEEAKSGGYTSEFMPGGVFPYVKAFTDAATGIFVLQRLITLEDANAKRAGKLLWAWDAAGIMRGDGRATLLLAEIIEDIFHYCGLRMTKAIKQDAAIYAVGVLAAPVEKRGQRLWKTPPTEHSVSPTRAEGKKWLAECALVVEKWKAGQRPRMKREEQILYLLDIIATLNITAAVGAHGQADMPPFMHQSLVTAQDAKDLLGAECKEGQRDKARAKRAKKPLKKLGGNPKRAPKEGSRIRGWTVDQVFKLPGATQGYCAHLSKPDPQPHFPENRETLSVHLDDPEIHPASNNGFYYVGPSLEVSYRHKFSKADLSKGLDHLVRQAVSIVETRKKKPQLLSRDRKRTRVERTVLQIEGALLIDGPQTRAQLVKTYTAPHEEIFEGVLPDPATPAEIDTALRDMLKTGKIEKAGSKYRLQRERARTKHAKRRGGNPKNPGKGTVYSGGKIPQRIFGLPTRPVRSRRPAGGRRSRSVSKKELQQAFAGLEGAHEFTYVTIPSEGEEFNRVDVYVNDKYVGYVTAFPQNVSKPEAEWFANGGGDLELHRKYQSRYFPSLQEAAIALHVAEEEPHKKADRQAEKPLAPQPGLGKTLNRYQLGLGPDEKLVLNGRKKKAKKKTTTAKELVAKCQKLWEAYCKKPGVTKLRAVAKHCEAMKDSKAKSVKAERTRCMRSIRAEAKARGWKL